MRKVLCYIMALTPTLGLAGLAAAEKGMFVETLIAIAAIVVWFAWMGVWFYLASKED